jgi:F0F1-type ATP synthase membrane subunit b/b'
MKNKTISSKIEALNTRIKSIKSKAENAKYLKESGVFQTLEADLETTLGLQKDIDSLKGTLKAKTQELEEGIKKLKKGSKDARKILKTVKKTGKSSKEEKILKEKVPAKSKKAGSKKKTAKSN